MIKLFRKRTPWGMREYDVFYRDASHRVLAENAEDAIERAGLTTVLYRYREYLTVRVVATKESILVESKYKVPKIPDAPTTLPPVPASTGVILKALSAALSAGDYAYPVPAPTTTPSPGKKVQL